MTYQFHIFGYHILILCLSTLPSVFSVTDIFTTWTMGSSPMPEPVRAQATGYDPYTGIIYLIGGALHNTQYVTYNTITNEMSSIKTIPNGGETASWMAQYYLQIDRTIYMYDADSYCIDTFNMETLTFTSCWTHFPSVPTDSLYSCMTIDSTGRYFYIIPETSAFFFYDRIEDQWYFGPDTTESAHLYPGCSVLNDKLYYIGGQVCWGHSCPGLRSIEYIDISDMETLKQNPTAFSWYTMTDFLPSVPEADFVRNIELNDIIYTVTGYRYYGDGTNIDVMGIDLINNNVDVLTEIPTLGIGGSLVWDSCKMQLYYFGGFDGSSDLTSWYYSNSVQNVYRASQFKADCMMPQYMSTTKEATTTTTIKPSTTTTYQSTTTTIKPSTTTTYPSTTTTTTKSSTTATDPSTTKKTYSSSTSKTSSSTLRATDAWIEVEHFATGPHGFTALAVVLVSVCIIIVCCVFLCCAYYLGTKHITNKEDDMKASLSAIVPFNNNVEVNVTMNTDDIRNWMENVVGFAQYTHNFVSNGYDRFDIIMDISDKKELEDIGITLKGHQIRIMKQILILKNDHWECTKCNTKNRNVLVRCKACDFVNVKQPISNDNEGHFAPGYDGVTAY